MISKQRLSQKFRKTRSVFTKHAIVQHIMGTRLLERLDYIPIQPKTILEFTTHLSLFSDAIQKRYPKAKIQTHCMAEQDLDTLHKHINTFDFIFSNCILPWVENTPAFLNLIHHLLAPNGVWLFSSFGPQTLQPLKAAWQKIDPHPHINPCADLHTLGDLLLAATFCDPVVDSQCIKITYKSLPQLLQDLKNTGGCVLKRPNLGLYTSAHFVQLECLLPKPIEADYELLYGISWKSNQLSFPLNLGVCT